MLQISNKWFTTKIIKYVNKNHRQKQQKPCVCSNIFFLHVHLQQTKKSIFTKVTNDYHNKIPYFQEEKKKVARNKEERYRPVSSFYFLAKQAWGK
jgi:hypothetical protein